MNRKRVTKEEKQQRHEWAMKQIDKGVGFSELASLISETWGCTRRNARHVVSLAHKEWMDIAFGAEEIDQRTCCSRASLAWSARRGRRRRLVSSQSLSAVSPSSTR